MGRNKPTKNKIIFYNPRLKGRARRLRNHPTFGEKVLWRLLRKKQLGYEFHRQVPIDQFIVDFYCHELMLAIEVDGISHDFQKTKVRDNKRQARIEDFGVTFLRFTDEEVMRHIEEVVRVIEEWIRVRAVK